MLCVVYLFLFEVLFANCYWLLAYALDGYVDLLCFLLLGLLAVDFRVGRRFVWYL